MLVIGTLLIFLGKSIFALTDCDEFRQGILCPLSQAENILDVVPTIEDKIQCQEECTRVCSCQLLRSFFQKEAPVVTSLVIVQSTKPPLAVKPLLVSFQYLDL